MKTGYKIALALLAGVTIGAATMKGLNAQTQPRAYHVGEVDVFDREGYAKNFVPLADPPTKAAGGRFVVRGGSPIAMEGDAPKGRIVILEFDNMEKLKAWRTSMKDADSVREKYARTRTYAVEGLAK
ncbi:MAG TPA: DUF1330 domain-containing protein [Pseudolabrys sp.]|nr:DUF1330 domain-containing protein [Pseudolabrys sp.]